MVYHSRHGVSCALARHGKLTLDNLLNNVRPRRGARSAQVPAGGIAGDKTGARVAISATARAPALTTGSEVRLADRGAGSVGPSRAAAPGKASGYARIDETIVRGIGQLSTPAGGGERAGSRPLARRPVTGKPSPRSSSAITKNRACLGHARTHGVCDDAAPIDTLN